MKFVLIHIAKTAGTTFSSMLQENCRLHVSRAFRKQPHKYDYWKMYVNPKYWVGIKIDETKLYEQYDVVRGTFPYQRFHYLVEKHGWKLITWIRDPIERVISHYNQFMFREWKRPRIELVRIIENMNIVEFSKWMGNFNTRFTGKDPSIFDFIGVVEEWDKSINIFNRQFDYNLQFVEKLNVAKWEKESVSPSVREELKQHHLKDYEFYEKVVKRYR